jgi:hypothetical protein
MVGLLTALKGTDLYERYQREGRLLDESSGDNVSISLNYRPELDRQVLIDGYKRVLRTLYDPRLENYSQRCSTLLENWNRRTYARRGIGRTELRALAKSIWRQIFSRQGPAYLRFLVRTVRTRPAMLSEAVRLAILGYHFEKITRQQMAVHEFREFLLREEAKLKGLIERFGRTGTARIDYAKALLQRHLRRVQARHGEINPDFRFGTDAAFENFISSVKHYLSKAGLSGFVKRLPLS